MQHSAAFQSIFTIKAGWFWAKECLVSQSPCALYVNNILRFLTLKYNINDTPLGWAVWFVHVTFSWHAGCVVTTWSPTLNPQRRVREHGSDTTMCITSRLQSARAGTPPLGQGGPRSQCRNRGDPQSSPGWLLIKGVTFQSIVLLRK